MTKEIQKRHFFKKLAKPLHNSLPIFILIILSVWGIWPFVKNPTQAFLFGGDDSIVVWILNQTIQKIPDNLENIFQGNVLHPYNNVLAYSVMLIPSAFISYVPSLFTTSHVVAFNATLVFAQLATAIILYLWIKEIVKDKWISLIAVSAFLFSSMRMGSIVHLHTWTLQWWLIFSWLIWKYAKNKKPHSLYIASVFLSIQFWENFYFVFWAIPVVLVFLAKAFKKKHARHYILSFLLFVVLSSPAIYAYITVAREFGQFGSIREHAHFSMSIDEVWKNYLSPGLFLLFALSLAFIRPLTKTVKTDAVRFLLLIIIGLIMALGPVLKWGGETVKILQSIPIPLPYSILFYTTPGLSAARSVHRWFQLSFIFSPFIIAITLSHFSRNAKRMLFLPLLIITIVGGTQVQNVAKFPFPENYPLVYRWLKRQTVDIVLEIPIYTWSDHQKHGIEMNRMVYSLEHKKGLINGSVGYMPKVRQKLLSGIANNLSYDIRNELKSLGTECIIVHNGQNDNTNPTNMDSNNMQMIFKDSASSVYILDL